MWVSICTPLDVFTKIVQNPFWDHSNPEKYPLKCLGRKGFVWCNGSTDQLEEETGCMDGTLRKIADGYDAWASAAD